MDTMADAEQTESNPTNADGLEASAATVDEQPDERSPELHEREKRTIKLTEKGQSWFLEESDKYVNKLRSIGDNLVHLLKFNPSEHYYSDDELTDIEQKLKECYDNYEHVSDGYLNFLSRHNTQESALEQSNHTSVRRTYADRVNTAKHVIFTELGRRATKPKTESKRSVTHKSSSRHSRSSGTSVSTIIDKKIKAEAAKARLKFIKKEVELKRSAAAIQADMDELNAYKEVAVAEAELSVVKDEYESDASVSDGVHSTLMRKYFDDDRRDTKPPSLNVNAKEFNPAKSDPVSPKRDDTSSVHSSVRHKSPSVQPPDDSRAKNTGTSVRSNTDKNNNSDKDPTSQQNVFSDFARFWFKKDLITKVDPFDYKPEHFLAWKNSFKRVMTELQVEPTEELDLLVRWLGPNSSVEARNIRACHTHNLLEGCDVIWRRLEERYGAPSLV